MMSAAKTTQNLRTPFLGYPRTTVQTKCGLLLPPAKRLACSYRMRFSIKCVEPGLPCSHAQLTVHGCKEVRVLRILWRIAFDKNRPTFSQVAGASHTSFG